MKLLDHPVVVRFDLRGERLADRLRGRPWADRLFYGLSAAGDHGIVWHVIGVTRALLGRDSWRSAVELSAGMGIEAALVNGPMKWAFRRERPVFEGERPRHLRTPRTSSFPSGHASAGMFGAVMLAGRGRRSWPWFVLGGCIGWSRVHVRIHHASDVAGGLVVGLLLGAAGRRIAGSVRSNR